MTYFVTGATGHLGAHVLAQLSQVIPAGQIIAGARSPDKARAVVPAGIEVRAFDYDRPETLAAALRGVQKLLLISGNDFVNPRFIQHRAVIAAAQQAGVGLVAYTSILHAATSRIGLAVDHQKTEQALAESGIPHVLLRNGWYNENYAESLGGALASGVFLGAGKEGRVAPAARADYAAAAVKVLTEEGHAGKIYELAGDRAYTLPDVAAAIATASGRDIRYQDLPEAEYSATLQKFGVPASIADALANADSGLARGELDDETHTLSRLIGRATTPLLDSFRAALSKNA
ncbi:MAG TPA: SDR family oxidoreductase [Pseudomonadota bacterium]|nr:SDR family oxidoreductase [Pseudomonadota bacterium]